MDTGMCGGPSTIAEDAARDVAGEVAGIERRTEGFPCNGGLVLCETAKGIVPCWVGLWGQPRGPPKTILRSGEAGAFPVLLSVKGRMIEERMAGWVGDTARMGMEKVHAGCLMKGR